MLYFRLVPIGFGTVVFGALSFLIGASVVGGTAPVEAFGIFLLYGLPVSVLVGGVLMVPIWAVWMMTFAGLANRWPEIRKRAAMASGTCAGIGVALLVALLVAMGDLKVQEWALFVPFLLVPIPMAAGLTWRAFSGRRAVE